MLTLLNNTPINEACDEIAWIIKLSKDKWILSGKRLEIGYISFIWPLAEYGDIIFNSFPEADSDKLENVQLETA